jgi:hypothetical protein
MSLASAVEKAGLISVCLALLVGGACSDSRERERIALELQPVITPVISAVDQFEKENGHLPSSLEEAGVKAIVTPYGPVEYTLVTVRGGYLLSIGEYDTWENKWQYGYDSKSGWYCDKP